MTGRLHRLALAACLALSAPLAAADRPSIVLISIDTLRSDRLPAYGYRAGSTPAIDALTRDVDPLRARLRARAADPALAPVDALRTAAGRARRARQHRLPLRRRPPPLGARAARRGRLRDRRRGLHLRAARRDRHGRGLRLLRGEARPGHERRPRRRAAARGGDAAPGARLARRRGPGRAGPSSCSSTSTSRTRRTSRPSRSRAGSPTPTTARSRPPTRWSGELLAALKRARRLRPRRCRPALGPWRGARRPRRGRARRPALSRGAPGAADREAARGKRAGTRVADPAQLLDVAPTLLELADLPRPPEMTGQLAARRRPRSRAARSSRRPSTPASTWAGASSPR